MGQVLHVAVIFCLNINHFEYIHAAPRQGPPAPISNSELRGTAACNHRATHLSIYTIGVLVLVLVVVVVDDQNRKSTTNSEKNPPFFHFCLASPGRAKTRTSPKSIVKNSGF